MKINHVVILMLALAIWSCSGNKPSEVQKYEPTFESLEKANPAPEWFKDAKFGIYCHWGVYSVPAYSNEWYPRNMYFAGSPENKHQIEKYGDIATWPYNNFITGANDKEDNFVQFAPKLKSEGGNFDPEEWAQLFADAGAKFAGPVAEHHDGFSMWASKVNPWNAKDMGPKLDLVGLLTDAIRKRDMKIFLSMHHAYNITGYYEAVPPTNDPKLQMLFGQQGKEKNEALWLKKHQEIIDMYQPDIVYQDFNLHKISQPVLLDFLAYYYNSAAKLNKEVVATFKDGLNDKCALLDYERGGPVDVTEKYWLTDDAISSSSWCYTDGIGYYSKVQILHAFIDRISKNGNMILNISPKPDGTIPQEQKDVLLAMGSWLKKYGEAIYATRAWEKYGEGPTKMGAAHGVFLAPKQGTSTDIRYTRSKDNSTLYAILLGWDDNEKEIALTSLASGHMDLKNLKAVELINGEAGKYLTLNYRQDAGGLMVSLPQRPFDEMAYVIKLSFEGPMSKLDNYADINCAPHYYLVPGNSPATAVFGADFQLSGNRKENANQWKFESLGKGFYIIYNRNNNKVLEVTDTKSIAVAEMVTKDNQVWKIEHTFGGLFKITNKQNPDVQLSVNKDNQTLTSWNFYEVCETKQVAFKNNVIPGTIEVEDFDSGCSGDAWYDKDDANAGGQYRPNEGVDIEKCAAGGYNIGWTNNGEFMAYTVNIKKAGSYQVAIYIATPSDNTTLHLECDGADVTGQIAVPNTSGYQSWQAVTKNIELPAGTHVLKLVVDNAPTNMDKMVFKQL